MDHRHQLLGRGVRDQGLPASISKASGDDHVVNTSAAMFGLFAFGMSGYNASKFAVRGFTEALRQELDLQRCGVSGQLCPPGMPGNHLP